MRSKPALLCSTVLSVATLTGIASASVAGGRLIPLIPAGAQIVAGVEQPHTATPHHPLLLITNNNRLDLDDWLSLTGVDAHRAIEEIVWAAASSDRSELGERLLLVDGRFDRARILDSARRNGAASVDGNSTNVLAVAPLPRDQASMHDTRWLAFPDERTALFGTPALVREALDRLATHAAPDSALVARLAPLRPDVTSWSSVAMSTAVAQKHVAPVQAGAPWLKVLELAQELTLGVHDGTTSRLDFFIHAPSSDKAQAIADLFHQPGWITIAGKSISPHLASLSVDREAVQASMDFPRKQFSDFVAAIFYAAATTAAIF